MVAYPLEQHLDEPLHQVHHPRQLPLDEPAEQPPRAQDLRRDPRARQVSVVPDRRVESEGDQVPCRRVLLEVAEPPVPRRGSWLPWSRLGAGRPLRVVGPGSPPRSRPVPPAPELRPRPGAAPRPWGAPRGASPRPAASWARPRRRRRARARAGKDSGPGSPLHPLGATSAAASWARASAGSADGRSSGGAASANDPLRAPQCSRRGPCGADRALEAGSLGASVRAGERPSRSGPTRGKRRRRKSLGVSGSSLYNASNGLRRRF